jgi:zinc protease
MRFISLRHAPQLSALVTAAVLWAALPAGAAPVSHFTLENGMDVVVIEDHRAPVVTHMVWYRVGAADEAPGKSGIAHFFEHLMFKGTDDVAPGAFSGIIEAQGGNDNAFTSWDYTAYFQRVAADRLGLMMQLEADRMRDLILNEEVVATERNVILEERSQRVDSDPGALMREQARAAQFLNHPYGVPIIGWRHEIAQLNLPDALEFYQTFYAPNNAVLVVAGDVTPEQVRALANEHYGPLKPTPGLSQERRRPVEPPQLAERRLVMADERVSEPVVARSYLAPERDPGAQQRAAALTYLAELLGGSGTTSVLARALQFESATAIYSTAFYDGLSLDHGTFGLAVLPAPGVSPQEAEDAMDAAIAAFLETGPDLAAFERIKTQLRAAEIYALDSAERRARRYGEALTSGLTLTDVEEWPAVLQAVTPEDVMAVASETLDRRRSVTTWLLQAEGAQK